MTVIDRAEIVRLYMAGLSMADVAESLDISKGLVQYHLKHAGVPRRARGRPIGSGTGRPPAECHPDLPMHAHGQCRECYDRKRNAAAVE